MKSPVFIKGGGKRLLLLKRGEKGGLGRKGSSFLKRGKSRGLSPRREKIWKEVIRRSRWGEKKKTTPGREEEFARRCTGEKRGRAHYSKKKHGRPYS